MVYSPDDINVVRMFLSIAKIPPVLSLSKIPVAEAYGSSSISFVKSFRLHFFPWGS
jgi:hypothetical protein